ncbi:MAG: alanyl-tRNA editing protein [Thermoplasmata archaeon]
MTELAYLSTTDDAYIRTFEARVVALPPGAVVLDRTYFYPAGGGQPNDEGFLSGGDEVPILVRQVTKSGSAVLHRIDHTAGPFAGLSLGASVRGTVDWERRYRHMRLHTAQHLLSALIFERAGNRTRRANLGGVHATLDLERPVEDRELWGSLERDINDHQGHPRTVSVTYMPRSEFDAHPSSRSGLVPLPAQVDPVRVIGIEGLDTCPCGGTHLRNTGEIGNVHLSAPANGTNGPTRVVLTLDASPPTPRA